MKIDLNRIIAEKRYCEEAFKYYLGKQILKESEKLFQKHINKALSNLEFANFLIEEHSYSIKEKLPNKSFYDWCVTIYYYAIYHVALALLAKLGYESKSHLATITAITLFYYHRDNLLEKEDIKFIIEKINLEKEEIDLITRSKDMRERACYNAGEFFELRQAQKLQKETAEFVSKIRLLISAL